MKKLSKVMILLVLLSMVLSACTTRPHRGCDGTACGC